MITKEQYFEIVALVEKYGEAEEAYGDYESVHEAEEATLRYKEVIDYLRKLVKE